MILSYSGLGLLSLLSRTKYQISHTVERHSPGSASLSVAKYSLHPPYWGYSEAAQVLLTSSLLQKTYCHTTCPVDITLLWCQNTVCSPSYQDWPNLSSRLGMPLVKVPVNCSPKPGDECECKSDPWHRVLLPVLCCTDTKLLLVQNTSDPSWHSVRLLVLCVYLLECLQSSTVSCRWYFWKYRWTASVVESAVPLLTNCMLWQAMQICTRVQQFVYKAQQLKDS